MAKIDMQYDYLCEKCNSSCVKDEKNDYRCKECGSSLEFRREFEVENYVCDNCEKYFNKETLGGVKKCPECGKEMRFWEVSDCYKFGLLEKWEEPELNGFQKMCVDILVWWRKRRDK